MEHEFWHERWSKKEIGFHEGSVNKFLYDHWPELSGGGTEGVFVPLCGKAHDMWWLHDRGHPVIGVELSEIACKDFFEEAGEKAMVHPSEPFTKFKHESLQLWCGDFFQLVPDDLKHSRLVYDRAALIALPPSMRKAYVEHLTAVIPDGTRILLITLDYGTKISPPPFNVSDEEVRELYSPDYEIEHILTNTLPNDHPFTKRKGLIGATESVFRLTKR
ncbi:thiopurine S-methyltransferase [Marinobacter sp. 1-4A]|uniref:thiopurine S-methyltransferase n=1 Tax=unclassified Marinobacter TaxID=83889 RepID=UPI001905D3E0|nr:MULTISPECIES: thiopurine S-methyltransferase [unclassified Marinobacter]MBK1850460.1 thiopurine S-methyltransferase [Marinobacter sp. 1-4A]MCK0163046.1 thiopurine S-methyltransferase [Marinobacter sp. S6332]